MGDVIKHFLLVFDRVESRLVEERSFGTDTDAAVAAYTATEREYADDPRFEIVLIGSDSIETVRVTHANYFPPSSAESRYFAEL